MTQNIAAAAGALEAAGIPFRREEPLKAHTTIRIGGAAALFCMPQNARQVEQAVKAAKNVCLPYFILGKGSNLLFPDEGYPGVIISMLGEAWCEIRQEGTKLTAGAGAALMDVCRAAQQAGIAGLEFAYGIPGSVGGAVYMNAGAYGGEVGGVLHSVRYLDESGEEKEASAAVLDLSYRMSPFQANRWCVLSATFQLQAGDKTEIDCQMQDYWQRRQAKQPLELPSAGSAFKRPPGAFAGALIEQCGLKGYRVGDAAISEKHSGFIVNLGSATAQDVLRLADHVAQTVLEKTGYTLEKEIRVVT